MSEPEARRLLALFSGRSALPIELGDLVEHVRRYAQFHAERAAFCAQQATDEDAALLRAECARYSEWIEKAAAWST